MDEKSTPRTIRYPLQVLTRAYEALLFFEWILGRLKLLPYADFCSVLQSGKVIDFFEAMLVVWKIFENVRLSVYENYKTGK